MPVTELKKGDKIVKSDDSRVEVKSFACWSEKVQTYNLILDGGVHTYFAGGLLAHNKSPNQCPAGEEQICPNYPQNNYCYFACLFPDKWTGNATPCGSGTINGEDVNKYWCSTCYCGVDQPPACSLTFAPSSPQCVGTTVAIYPNATDDVGVSTVMTYVNTNTGGSDPPDGWDLIGESSSGNVSWTSGNSSHIGGTHVVAANVWDAAQNLYQCRANYTLLPPVPGGWSSWGSCISCSQSRTCTNPAPSCGGATCSGSATQACGNVDGGWSDWSAKNLTCGYSGVQTRTCTNPAPVCAGADCSGLDGGNSSQSYTNAPCAPTITAACVDDQATVSWSAPAGTDHYSLRIDDNAVSWSGACPALSPDLCQDQVPTSYVFTAVYDRPYQAWVHAANSGGMSPSSDVVSFTCVTPNSPPTFSSLTLKNNLGNVVVAETGSRNQICQTAFNGVRTIQAAVTGADVDGVADITDIQLRWNGISLTRTSLVLGVANFSYTFDASQNNINSYGFVVIEHSLLSTSVFNNNKAARWNSLKRF